MNSFKKSCLKGRVRTCLCLGVIIARTLIRDVIKWEKNGWEFSFEQECIPVGCVPPAAVAVGGSPPCTPHGTMHPPGPCTHAHPRTIPRDHVPTPNPPGPCTPRPCIPCPRPCTHTSPGPCTPRDHVPTPPPPPWTDTSL